MKSLDGDYWDDRLIACHLLLPYGRLLDFTGTAWITPGRERDWRRAIAECQRFADAALAWLETPDLPVVRPLERLRDSQRRAAPTADTRQACSPRAS